MVICDPWFFVKLSCSLISTGTKRRYSQTATPAISVGRAEGSRRGCAQGKH